ncbi:MAG: isopeptide-forming domain-containing fimbrial protein [Slackia sp.]|nr:isopeptide-forming domain-containing fimbrial protein [Slackia sp.]
MENNGKRGTPGMRQGATTALAQRAAATSAKAAALLAAAIVVLCGAILPAPAAAQSKTADGITIEEVPESEFEPIGYEASLDFDDLEIVKGFEEVEDLGIYFDHRLSDGDNPSLDDLYLQVKGHPGLAFPIDESTEKGSAELRYTGGTYKGEAFDAVVTLSDWEYFEPECGWENYEPFYEGHEVFQPGVYLSTHWKSLSDGPEGFQNFNFYTVGISKLVVSVQFVKAGTDEPIEVKGHATCIDLDTTQAFEFGGAITGARITEGNDVLFLENGGTRVGSKLAYLSTDGWKHPDEYKKGLVETFYDTTGENRGKAAEFRFFPGWRESAFEDGGWPDPQSFFALTPDFLTAPNPEENPDGQTEVVKTADKTEGVTLDDQVEYAIDFKAHEQGVNCRVGYRYSALEIVDMLPAEMTYVESSGYLENENGERIEGAGSVIATGTPIAPDASDGDDQSGTEDNQTGQNSANPDGEATDQTSAADENAPATKTNASEESPSEEGEGENAENTVSFVFDKEYLATMPMKGEHYRFVFKAALTSYPADGSLSVKNSSYALINSKGKTPSNDVDTGLVKPKLAIEKSSDKQAYLTQEIGHYTLRVTQIEEGLVAHNVAVKDGMLEHDIAEIVEGSIKATGPDGAEIDITPSYLRDETEHIAGFEFETGADLAHGEILTVSYDALMHTAGTTLENEARASAEDASEAIDSNQVEITAVEAPDPDILLEKSADKERASVGDEISYRIVATVKAAEATDVVISDNSLPEGMPIDADSITLKIDGADMADIKPAIEDNGFSFSLGTLDEGSVVEIAYTAQVEDENLAETDVVNTAILTTAELDEPLSDEAIVKIVANEQPAIPPATTTPDAQDTPPSEPAPSGKFVKTGDATGAYLFAALGMAGLSAAIAIAVVMRRHATNGKSKRAHALARATEFGANGSKG